MTSILPAALATAILGSLVWRYLCRFRSIPWPYWLAWWLENPYMKVFCHPEVIAHRIQVKPGMRILEIGCGAGRITIPVARLCQDQGYILGLDLQAGMLKLFAKRLAELKLKSIEIRQQNFTEVPPIEVPFDRVVMVTVLGEIPNHHDILVKIKQGLTPGGMLSITEVLPDPCYLTRSYLKKSGEAAGFQVKEVYSGLLSYTMNFVPQSAD